MHSHHEEGITACEEFLNMRDHLVPSTADLRHFIWLILTKISFSFNGNYYLQIHGTALGTRMPPSFTNLFIWRLESKFLLTKNIKSQEWWRFIDDIFFIGHIENNYYEILSRALTVTTRQSNSLPTLSAEKLTFLDTTVYLDNGRIKTDFHF